MDKFFEIFKYNHQKNLQDLLVQIENRHGEDRGKDSHHSG